MDHFYVVIEAISVSNLEAFVNSKIEEGYEPAGGIAFVKNPYGPDQYVQAMFKRPST